MGLLSKLAGAGLKSNILACIRNNLLNKKAFVRVGDVYSEPYMMEAGCPACPQPGSGEAACWFDSWRWFWPQAESHSENYSSICYEN